MAKMNKEDFDRALVAKLKALVRAADAFSKFVAKEGTEEALQKSARELDVLVFDSVAEFVGWYGVDLETWDEEVLQALGD